MRKIRKWMSSIGAAALAVTLACGSLPADAAAGQTGKIVIDVPDGYNGTFDAYKVADYVPETSQLTVAEPFQSGYPKESTAITMDNIQYDNADTKSDATFRKLVEDVRSYYNGLSSADRERLTKVNTNAFSKELPDVPFGLYLIVQAAKGDGYQEMQPFLVILPQQTGAAVDGIQATVTVEAKLEKEPNPPEEPDNPPGDDTPPETPPVTPPETPNEEEEGGEETTPTEEIGSMGEDGSMNEMGEYGAWTGDNSQMMTYVVVAGVAAAALIVWVIWKKNRDKR